MKVGKLSGWSVLILPWLTLVTAKVYQVLSKISAHSKSILWLLLHWDCSIYQYHIQRKMFGDFVFWWQTMMTICQNIILRIEKILFTIRQKILCWYIIFLYSNFTLHFDIFGVPNQRVCNTPWETFRTNKSIWMTKYSITPFLVFHDEWSEFYIHVE